MLRHTLTTFSRPNRFLLFPQIRHRVTQSETKKDGINFIIEEHGVLRNSFEHYKQMTQNSKRWEMAPEICKKIAKHQYAEEQHLYPLFKKYFKPRDVTIVGLHFTEHQTMKEFITLVLDREPGAFLTDKEFYEKAMERLIALTEIHMKDEEKTLQELAEKMDPKEREELEDKMREAIAAAPDSPWSKKKSTQPQNE